MEKLDLFKKMLWTIEANILIGCACFALNTSGKIPFENAITVILLASCVLSAINILWFSDNLKDIEFTKFSRSIWTSLLLTFTIITYILHYTEIGKFVLCTAFKTKCSGINSN